MSRELASLLQSRARLDVMRWPVGIALSVGLHLGVAAAILVGARSQDGHEDAAKVTWVTLPAAGGTSGGAGAQEVGESGERVRKVEEVASRDLAANKGRPTPEGLSASGKRLGVKGTNPNAASTGQARDTSKGKVADPQAARGASGSGGGGGVGAGSGIPGLQASGGASGGIGSIGELDGSFPFAWYLQQVQNRIATNWYRPSGVQGRVLVYFRIQRDGQMESIRLETPSPNQTLNDSAERAVRRANPVPPLPPAFEGQYLGVWFWFTSN